MTRMSIALWTDDEVARKYRQVREEVRRYNAELAKRGYSFKTKDGMPMHFPEEVIISKQIMEEVVTLQPITKEI